MFMRTTRKFDPNNPEISEDVNVTVLRVSLTDCPHIYANANKRMREDLENYYGKDHPFIQAMFDGRFQGEEGAPK